MVENLKNQYGCIEIIRFVSAILIALLHINWWIELNPNIYFIQNGEKIVPVFCVIAGLLSDKTLSKNLEIKYYINSRLIRILPLYFLSIIILILINKFYGYSNLIEDKLSYLIQNIFMLRIINAPFLVSPQHWSLTVEIFFYITIPIFYLYKNKYKIIGIFTLILIISDFIGPRELGLYKFLFMGILANVIINYNLKCYHKTIILLLSFIYLAVYLNYIGKNIVSQNNVHTGIITCIFLIGLINNKYINIKSNSFTNYLSNISYSIYTFHVIVLIIYKDIKLDGTGNLNVNKSQESIYIYLIYLTITILISTITYYFYEKPIIKIFNKINKRNLINN